MSDNWIKDAEQKRQQSHGADQIHNPQNDEHRLNEFWKANYRQVEGILKQLGETWKALDPNRPGFLFLGRHPGNDYFVHTLSPLQSIALYLLNKTNLDMSLFLFGNEYSTFRTRASVYIKLTANGFSLHVPSVDILRYRDVHTLEQLQAALAETWANNQVALAKK